MKLSKTMACTLVLLLLSTLLIETVGFSQDQGREQEKDRPEQQQTSGKSQQEPERPSRQVPTTNVEAVIERAESSYRQGEAAAAKGQLESARRLFDQALDEVLSSGVDVRPNSRLEAYFRDLVDRIHKYDAQPGDDHKQIDEHQEITEPAVLDQLSTLNEAELATVTPGGVKIFGSYDFDFTVATPVLQFIEFFVLGRGRSTMEVGLQRSGRYRQMAEKVFKEEHVPLDLIWLAQAESVWKPNALSRAAAKGIWQFVPSTGTRYGLVQTAWVDDRSQPEKSTRAAARYLRWLYEHFAGDWLLAMAAYNSGEGRVDDAIARSGYADFWELYRRGMLPQETRNYVPIILSIMIISKNQKRYGFDVKADPPLTCDLFELPAQTDLKVIADLLGVPYEVIQEINPELRRGVSPLGQSYTVRLPKGMKKAFEIAYAKLPEDQRVRRVVIPREEIAQEYRSGYRVQLVSYQARGGDTLIALSRKYGISVRELARLNRMSARGTLRKGQTLRIPMKKRPAALARVKGHKHGSRYKEEPVSRARQKVRYREHRAGTTRRR